MNRRLQTPIIACTAFALALSGGLMLWAGVPSGDTSTSERPAEPLLHGIEEAKPASLKPRRLRSGFALPYFSFARVAGRS